MNKLSSVCNDRNGYCRILSEAQIDSFTESWCISVFYESVANANEITPNDKNVFDCRKIMIADNILERWENKFIEQHGKNHVHELFMYLAQSGPKTDSNLNENEVEILEGFVSTNEN